MAPQNSHRQKRPFQPSITTYFTRTDRESYEHSLAPSRQPILDADIQSDLLGVGMRIRKAVPEGYKTHKSSRQNFLYDNRTHATPSNAAAPSTYYQQAELLPFCGLHKIGGHSVQITHHPVDSQAHMDIFADHSIHFTSSQESTTSTLSTDSMPAAPMLNPLQANKRRFLDEQEDEDIPPFQLHFSSNPFEMSSNVSLPVSHTDMPDLDAISSRTMAKPRSRRKRAVAVVRNAVDDVDFEEASFLEWENGEVEMGGT